MEKRYVDWRDRILAHRSPDPQENPVQSELFLSQSPLYCVEPLNGNWDRSIPPIA